jgi:hypothetical protein
MSGDNAAGSSGPVPVNGLIELGTITLTTSGLGTTQFTLANYAFPRATDGYTDTFNGNNGNGFNLDLTSSSPAYVGASSDPETFSVDVLASPEPTSLVLLVGALSPLAFRRRRGRLGVPLIRA